MAIGRTNAGGAGGASLNFKVVPGLTQPGTAAENTIWVKTESLTGWYFAATQPENMQEGEVWFPTGTESAVEFNALKKNAVQVYPLSAKQLTGGVLVDVEAMSYQGGEWAEWWSGELYDAGNEFEIFTGGWGIDGYTSTGANSILTVGEKKTDYMYFVGASGKTNLLATLKSINVDRFNTLYIDGEPISVLNNELSVGVSINKSKSVTDRINAMNFSAEKKRQIMSMDISSVSGDVYVLVYGHASSSCIGKVYRIWFK